SFCALDQRLQRFGVVFSKLRSYFCQAPFRMRTFGCGKSFRPVEIIVSNPNEDQIRKSFLAQNLTRLSSKIACSDNSSTDAFADRSGRDESPGAIVFCSDYRRKSFQSFKHTINAGRIGIGIEKPILASLGSGSPKQANRRGYVEILCKAVTHHRHMGQAVQEFSATDRASPVLQVIAAEWRGRL